MFSKKVVSALISTVVTMGLFCNTSFAASGDTEYADAYNKVTKCIASKSQKSVNDARISINKLKNTGAAWAIGEFSKQVDQVQHPILVGIVNSINKTSKKFDIYEIEKNRKVIKDLPEVQWVGAYSSALDKQVAGVLSDVSQKFETFKAQPNGENMYRVFDSISRLGGTKDKDVFKFIMAVRDEVVSTKLIEEDKLLKDVAPNIMSEVGDFIGVDGHSIDKDTITVGGLRQCTEAFIDLPDYPKYNYFYVDKYYYLSLLNNCKKINIFSVKKEYGCAFLAGLQKVEKFSIFPTNKVADGVNDNILGVELGNYENVKELDLIDVGGDQVDIFQQCKDVELFKWLGMTTIADRNNIDFSKFSKLYKFDINTDKKVNFEFLVGNNSIDSITVNNLYKDDMTYDEIFNDYECLNKLSTLTKIRVNMYNRNKVLKSAIQDALPNVIVE